VLALRWTLLRGLHINVHDAADDPAGRAKVCWATAAWFDVGARSVGGSSGASGTRFYPKPPLSLSRRSYNTIEVRKEYIKLQEEHVLDL